MKVTKQQLKKIIKESIFDSAGKDSNITGALEKLLKGIENLDVSVDYLSAVMTGTSPLSTGIGQKIMGRYRTPPVRRPAPAELKEENNTISDWKIQLEEAIMSLYGTGYGHAEIREMVENTFGVVMEEIIDEKKAPSEKTLKKMEKSLTKTAKEKFPKDEERQNAYIYGTKRKTGWKPEREK